MTLFQRAALVLLALGMTACGVGAPATHPPVTTATPANTPTATTTATATLIAPTGTPTLVEWREGRTVVLTFSGTGLELPASCLISPSPVPQPPLFVGGQEVTDGVMIGTTQNITDRNGPHLVDTILVPARFVSIDVIGSGTSGRLNTPINLYRLCFNVALPDANTHTVNHLVIGTYWTTGTPVPAYVLSGNDVPSIVLDQTLESNSTVVSITDQFVSMFKDSLGKQVLLVVASELSGDPAQNAKLQDIIRALRAGQLPPASDSFASASGPKIGHFLS